MKLGDAKPALAIALLGLAVLVAGCATVSSKGSQNLNQSSPSISAQPSSQAVTTGQTAMFTVVANGTAPLTYQWQKNGTTISGAVSSSYITPPTTTADNGAKFQVVVANAAGSMTSNAAMLTVNPAVTLQSIAVTPANPSITQSQTQQFTATGTYSDGSTKSITTTVTWASSNTAVATIGASTGLATGITAGTSQISATLGSIVSPNDTLTVTASNSYATNFPLTENPISEGGKWVNGGTTGLDWTNIRTTASVKAYGTSSGVNRGYDDSTAVLQGYATWGKNQSATGVVYLSSATTAYDQEVELRLNTTIAAHSITGYECNYSTHTDGTQYSQIVRWNGALGNFTPLGSLATGIPQLANGDTLTCQNVNGVITMYRNGAVINSVTDTTYTGGSPGIGTDLDNNGASTNGNFGFSSFSASDSVSSGSSASVRSAAEITAGVARAGRANVDVVTYHNDAMRTGLNSQETILTPTNVNSATFGKVGEFAVDGRIDGQILYLSQLAIPGKGTKNVLYFATEKDTVYAVDADSINGSSATILWQTPALGADETAVPLSSLPCGNIDPNGITATPVIDRERNAIYVIAMSADGWGHFYHRLHALDLTTGKELFGGPATVNATYSGTGGNSSGGTVTFLPQVQAEGAALLENGNKIYTTWGGRYGDCGTYSGWVIAFDAGTLAQESVIDLVPSTHGAGVWLGDGGPASDNSGDVYLTTGNAFGTNTPGIDSNYGNTFIRLSGSTTLSPVDYFAPSNAVASGSSDRDFGSSGPLLLPDLVDSGNSTRHLAVVAGEDGAIYVVNRDNMGQYNASKNNVYQQLPGDGHANYSSPVYFNNTVFLGPSGLSLRAYPISQAFLVTSPATQSAHVFGNYGTVPSVSSNGNTNGIVWALDYEPGILFAYDATDLTKELYNSTQAAGNRDHFSVVAGHFITPLVVNGKVYCGTGSTVAAFGLLGQ